MMMQQTLFALSLGFAGVILATHAGHAAQCAPRDQVMVTLAEKYEESRQAIGLAGPQAVMELYASAAGSWTIMVTMPDGMSCLLASGQGYQALLEPAPAKGDPA